MSDVCPTGLAALERSDMRHLPLAVWMAAQRHFEHARRHPKMATIFEQALADIEVAGLLRQAEAALGTSHFSAPGVLSEGIPDQEPVGAGLKSPELRSPVPEPANNSKPTNNTAMSNTTNIHVFNAATPARDRDRDQERQNARLLHLSAECLRLTGLLHAAEQKINRARMSATIAMGSFNALGQLFRKKEAEIGRLSAELVETKASNATLLKALHRAETAAAAHHASH